MLVSISSGWFAFDFFLFFLGDVGGTVAAGVFGVAVDVVGDTADFCVAGVGVADAGVAGGSGVAATAIAATAADDGGALLCF